MNVQMSHPTSPLMPALWRQQVEMKEEACWKIIIHDVTSSH